MWLFGRRLWHAELKAGLKPQMHRGMLKVLSIRLWTMENIRLLPPRLLITVIITYGTSIFALEFIYVCICVIVRVLSPIVRSL